MQFNIGMLINPLRNFFVYADGQVTCTIQMDSIADSTKMLGIFEFHILKIYDFIQ